MVVIVSSVTAKIFNPRKCWTVTIQLFLNDTLLISAFIAYCQLFIVRASFVQCLLFNSVFHPLQSFLINLILLFSV
jgi:hypothetical protein